MAHSVVSSMGSNTDIVGRVLNDRYTVVRSIGKGGMGTVYEAEDTRLGRKVAVKVLRSRSEGDLSEQRFSREIRATSRLHHPNICSVFDSGRFVDGYGNDRPFLVLEFIDGQSLHERLGDTRLSSANIEHITVQIARGLAVAHAAGVIHGDLKPQNIMLQKDLDGSERVQLVDFGLAKVLDEVDASLTQTGVIIGSPRYLAPERLHGDRDDPRSDIYALGVILYEMLTGRPPFVAKNTPTLMLLHLTEKPAPPSTICARPIPDALNRLCLALLEKDPDNRPQSAEAVAKLAKGSGRPSILPDLFDLNDDDDDVESTQTSTRTDGLTTPDSAALGAIHEPELPEGEVVLAWCRAPDLVRYYRENPRVARRADAVVTEVTAPGAWGGMVGHTAPGSYFYIFPYMKSAMEWAMTAQRDLLHADYPEAMLNDARFAPVVEDDTVVYRGVRIAVALMRDDCARRRDRWTGRTRFFGPAVTKVESWAGRVEPGETGVVGGIDDTLCLSVSGHALGATDHHTQTLYSRIVPEELAARSRPAPSANDEDEDTTRLLLGRDATLDEVGRLVKKHRLVTLTGAAGAGKSALAARVAEEFASGTFGSGTFAKGTHVVDLAAAQTRADIEAALATAFGFVGPTQEARNIITALAGHDARLIVLDNCEHLQLEIAQFLGDLAKVNRTLHILATSRAPLGLSYERRHEVTPLSTSAAAELYTVLCAQHGHPVRDEELSDVRTLVQRLDGLPLAVELAAGRCAVLRPKDIAARLDSDAGVLRRTGNTSQPGLTRQETLDQALEWSWNLLNEPERHAFVQCSVFGGGFDLEAAEAVLDLSLAPGAPPVLDLLQSLRDKSLLHNEPGPDIRFNIYKTLGAFLIRKAEQPAWRPLMEAVERRHAHYYIARARELWVGRRGISSKEVLAALFAEEENLRRIVDRFESAQRGWALSAAFFLCSLYSRRGLSQKRVLLLARIRTWPKSDHDRAVFLAHEASIAFARGELDAAERAYTLGLERAKLADDAELVIDFLSGLAKTLFRQLRIRDAGAVLEQAAPYLKRPGVKHLSARIESQRIASDMGHGKFAKTASDIQSLLVDVKKTGDVESEMRLNLNLGTCLSLIGRIRDSEAAFQAALQLADVLGDDATRGLCLGNLGGILVAMQRIGPAHDAFCEAIALHQRFGNRILEGTDRGYLAQVEHIAGNFEEAVKQFDLADALLREHEGREYGMLLIARLLFDIETADLQPMVPERIAAARDALGPLAEQSFFAGYASLVEQVGLIRETRDTGDGDAAQRERSALFSEVTQNDPFTLYVRTISLRVVTPPDADNVTVPTA